jgi:nicotinic acid mononucleotide adenylyltransferase
MEKNWFLKRPHQFIYTVEMDISSTNIRRKLRCGEDVGELTQSTLQYIKEHELYV